MIKNYEIIWRIPTRFHIGTHHYHYHQMPHYRKLPDITISTNNYKNGDNISYSRLCKTYYTDALRFHVIFIESRLVFFHKQAVYDKGISGGEFLSAVHVKYQETLDGH